MDASVVADPAAKEPTATVEKVTETATGAGEVWSGPEPDYEWGWQLE